MDLGPQINQGLKHLSEFELTMVFMFVIFISNATLGCKQGTTQRATHLQTDNEAWVPSLNKLSPN